MMGENREFLLAIALSIVVLLAWQVFVGMPQMEQAEKQRAAEEAARQTVTSQQAPAPAGQAPGVAPAPGLQPALPGAVATAGMDRAAAIAATPRVAIDTPSLRGSINLKGARIDDLHLRKYHETVDPKSPEIVLLSPSGSADPFYADFGWSAAPGTTIALPGPETVWTAQQGAKLTPTSPVTLTWDNGEGLVFSRTISVDADYLFTLSREVRNSTGSPVTLYPYALISRHGLPKVENFFVLHEGLIGVLGDEGLQEIDYDDLDEDSRVRTFNVTGGWLGFTDKYWAAALIPDQSEKITARFSNHPVGGKDIFQSDYLLEARTVPAGGRAGATGRMFAGAKVVSIVDGYSNTHGIPKFDLLIDWGWFYIFTKPMFWLIDWLYRMVGNFGVAILLTTVIVKLVLFPLANKSYASMSKMKLLQPEMMKLKERYGDDRVKQQQAMMELYKKEKVNPMSGCLPIVVQIPIFFALYKVLFGTIEMRHAPFFGWIQDLAAPDPTSLFNLFGLIPWAPPSFLMIGIWPIIMGVTMFLQMRLNPTPPDPIQAQIFTWMPLFFTFLLATFPAGLVIYWAWNNFLSILQQATIMHRQGVKIELWDNLKSLLSSGKKSEEPKT
jgi:YidC/Oxa1 family membrane protein insertase